MCDTTKSTSKDDEDIDIYSELPNFKYDENLLKLEEDNKALKSKVAELMNKLKSLETQLKTCEKTNANYRRNISMLFLSAKREIERKDRTISELRSKSFHEARRDFPRRTRNEAVGRRNISKTLEEEKTRPPPATSETPVVTQPKKIGYCFTAGNLRSGSQKCQFPVKDSKAQAGGKSCKDDSKSSGKRIDCSTSVLPEKQLCDSEETHSKNIKRVTDESSVSDNRENSSKNTDNVKESRGEKDEQKKEQTEKRKSTVIIQDERRPQIVEHKSTKSSSRSKSPIYFNRRRSPRISERRKSPMPSDRRKSPIPSDRRKSPIPSDRRKSSKNLNKGKSPITSSRSRSPIGSSRSRSPKTSERRKLSTFSDTRKSPARRDVGKRSIGGRHVRSGSVLRRIDHRSRSIRSRSRVSSTLKRRGKCDKLDEDIESRGKLAVGEEKNFKESTKSDAGCSGVKSASETQTMFSRELKSVDKVVVDGKAVLDKSEVISNKIDPNISSVAREINSENQGESVQVSENVIPIDNTAVMDTTEARLPAESMEEGNDQTPSEDEQLARMQSLPPLVGPWTQFSVRRYKKLYGFSPVKPYSEHKKVVNIKCIEKKNLFENKIERTVVTEIDGKTTEETINIELDKGLETNKILESKCGGKLSNENLDIVSVKDEKDPGSNKLSKSITDLESCPSNDINNDTPSSLKNQKLDNETSEQCALNDRNSDISSDSNNHNLESGSQSLPNESEEILPKLDANPSISESDKENQSENESMNAKNTADDKNPSYQDSDRSTDKSEKLINSEPSAENVVPEETNCADNGKSDEVSSAADCTDSNLLTNNQENKIPVISVTICDSPESVSDSLKESVKEIESCVSESIEDLNQITETEKGCQADGEKPVDDQDSTKITCNEKSVDDHGSTKITGYMNLSCSDLQVRNEGSSKDSEKEACSNENASEQLKLSTNTSQQDNENVVLSCANVLLSLSTEFEFSEGIEGDKTCCEASSNNMKLSSEIGVLESSVEVQEKNASSEELNASSVEGQEKNASSEELNASSVEGQEKNASSEELNASSVEGQEKNASSEELNASSVEGQEKNASSEELNASSVEGQEKNATLDELNESSVKSHEVNATAEKLDESILEEQRKNASLEKLNESGVEGQEKDTRVEQFDDVVNTDVKGQETVGNTNLKEVLITDYGSNAFEKSDTPEIDDPPADKSSKLTVEKPKIIDNISSSLHTFNSALDFSISTTNTNSLNADNIFEQQRQKAQLSASSLQVVNALKKLPKIRENFLQLFGESSNQENLKDSETGTPSKENDGKQCSTTAISKELKSLSCSSSLSSSSTSSSSMSSSSSFSTREKSSESAIPQVIRLFGIDITEEHSPFHVCKSSSQNSIMEEKVDEISHSTDTKRCRKTSTDRPTEGNKSETVTSKTNTVVAMEQVDAVLEKKSVKTDCSLTQVVIETKIVESQGQNRLQEKPVISKEIICEEPVIFPVPIIIVDKASDDKSGNEKASSQDNRATGEYYSNFTEALRNETNVSTAKTDVSQPEFQFESPSRYIMRINSNSVTSHKGFEITQSQSITGEDTLTMVRRLAKPVNTLSPIKSPSKRSVSRSSKSDSSQDNSSLTENKGEKEDRVIESNKKLNENEKILVKDENKIAKSGNSLAQTNKKLTESDQKLAVDKVNEIVSTKKVEQPKSVPKEEMKTNLDFIAKKDKVSVSLSSEHFEFRRRRSTRPVVKINRSSFSNKQDVDKSKAATDEHNKGKVDNKPTTPSKSDKQATTPKNDKPAESPKNNIPVISPINDKQAVSPQDDKSAKSLKRGAKSPKNVKQNLGKHSITSSKKGIKSQISPLATRQDSIKEKQPLSSPSPRSYPTKEKSAPEPARKESIEDIKDKKHLSSVRNALNQLKRPLVPSRNDSIQRTQGFKRRRVVINRMAQNDLIKLGSKPTNETPKVENSVGNCEITNIAKDASPIASSSGLERLQSSSGSGDSKPSLKRINDGSQLGPGKLMKLDNCVAVGRSKDLTVTGKVVDESKTSQQRHRNAGKFDSRTRSTTKVSDTVRSSNRSGLTDVKSDVCERRSPSEYFNRSINRRYRGLLRDRKLRGRSPLVSRRRVDKNMMNMRETRERGDNRTSTRVAERSADNDVHRSSTLNFVEWKLKPIDFRRQRVGSLFERLVAEKVLEKLDKPRTYIRADPGEATPPPMVVPCSNDNRVLVDQANRSNQILSSPDLSNRSSQATNHPDTPKSTNNTQDTATSEIVSSKPASQPNKVVIIRRRSNNAPKVLGDSVGTFLKTSCQVSSPSTEEKATRAIVIRRERSRTLLEDSPRSQTILTESSKSTVDKDSPTPDPCNENQRINSKKEVRSCEVNSRVGLTVSTRIVKTQLDFRSRLRRGRK